MAHALQTLTVALHGVQHPFPVVSLTDRRKKPARRKQFALTRGIERMLYGVTSRSTGAWAAHLDKHDLEESVLVADKVAVEAGVLLQAELDAGACPRPLCRRRRPPLPLATCRLPSARAQCSARCAAWWTSKPEAACVARRSCRSASPSPRSRR